MKHLMLITALMAQSAVIETIPPTVYLTTSKPVGVCRVWFTDSTEVTTQLYEYRNTSAPRSEFEFPFPNTLPPGPGVFSVSLLSEAGVYGHTITSGTHYTVAAPEPTPTPAPEWRSWNVPGTYIGHVETRTGDRITGLRVLYETPEGDRRVWRFTRPEGFEPEEAVRP